MNKKILGLFLLTLLASLALVSAQIFLSAPDALTESKNSTSFVITNPASSGIYNITISPISITDSKGNIIQITANPSSVQNLINGSTQTIALSYSSLPSNLVLGKFSTSILATATNSTSTINSTTTLSFINSFCDKGDIGTALEITKLEDEKLDNEDEWKWHPLDNIEITVKVHNAADRDLDTEIEYGLYNPDTNEFIDLDEDTIDLSVDEGESEEAEIRFQVPSDIDKKSNYRFYVKVYQEGKETSNCTDKKDGDYYEEVEVIRETRAVVLSEIKTNSPYMCGDKAEIKADLVNIGEEDEDQVLVTLYNKELGVNVNKIIDNLDSGDEESISFSFDIPENAAEKTYTLELRTRYKFDEDNSGCSEDEDIECYDKNSLDDLDKDFKATIKVEGNCAVKPATENTLITATLESDAVAGQQVIVKANIKNLGTSSQTYTILTSGTENFGTLESIDPQTFTVTAGQSKDVLITLKANSDADGDYTFDIKAISGSTIKQQQVSLAIEGKTSPFSGLNSLFTNLGDNWLIWVIVLVNIVLIVLIIVVAVRIARK